MKSPLSLYDETAKQFGITAEKQVHLRQKQAFSQAQVDEMKTIANRLLFDIATTKCHMDTAKDDNTKAAYEGKLRTYENDLRQMSASLDYAIAFDKELAEVKADQES